MLQPLVDALATYTDRIGGPGPFLTDIPGIMIMRSDHIKEPVPQVYEPSICMVLQGAKLATFGSDRFTYGAGQGLVVSLDMPGVGRLLSAKPEEPFLCLAIQLDSAVVRSVLAALDHPPDPDGDVSHGVSVAELSQPVLDIALRMVRLLDTPQAIGMLYPGMLQELVYWLLTSPSGGAIAKVVLSRGRQHRLVAAIHTLRERYTETIRVDDLAAIAQLSASAFQRQFKLMTGMSPLQYQKQLRLIEARRLMLFRATKAETAAFEVGYESASQFSREYARMFGAPPRRDIERLRALAA